MDNSLITYKKMVENMIEEMIRFSDALNYHVIKAPREAMENAVRIGFPSDIAERYMNNYFSRNESDVNDIIRYINSECIPYLSDVALYIGNAMNRDGSVNSEKLSGTTILSSSHIIERDEALAINNKEIEDRLGIKRSVPMTIEEADKQNANPNFVEEYIEDENGDFVDPITGVRYKKNSNYNPWTKDIYEPFSVNCATCATAYVLRLRGFDITAKGNVIGSGSLNDKISNADEYLDVWKNQDGTNVVPYYTDDWMKKNNINKMSIDDYRNYFEETCRAQGVYVVMISWKDDSNGHATILQRDANGILYYVEPQRYEKSKGEDGRRSLDDLLMTRNGKLKLSVNPKHGFGVLRVDDKLFNTKYTDLFDINKL